MAKFVVCYDVSDEKKRGKLRKKLKSLGLHSQWSVFEVEADKVEEVVEFVKTKIEAYESLTVFRSKGVLYKLGADWEEPKFKI